MKEMDKLLMELFYIDYEEVKESENRNPFLSDFVFSQKEYFEKRKAKIKEILLAYQLDKPNKS